MKIKVLALCLSMLFFGSIATTAVASVVDTQSNIVRVDDDKKKKTAKADKSATKKDCATKKSCCSSSKTKSCTDKKDGDKK